MLDANVISVMARDPRGAAARRARQVGFASICTSIVVVGEVRYGLLLKASRELDASVEPILAALDVEPLGPSVSAYYAEVRSDLKRRGTPVGANDLWIAAHALALDCTLVTANNDEFVRVVGLQLDDWQRA